MGNNYVLGGMVAALIVVMAMLSYLVYVREPVIIPTTGGLAVQGNINTVTVTGTAQQKVDPDLVIIRLAVETTSPSANSAEEKNSVEMGRVIGAIKDAGVDSKDIVTEYYTLYPYQEWVSNTDEESDRVLEPDDRLSKSVKKGFRVHHSIKVTVRQTDDAGEVIDAAVNAGATSVESVYFTLSEAKEKKIREDLIENAANKARERANALTTSLGASVGKVISINEQSFTPPIYYAKAVRNQMVMEGASQQSAVPDLGGEEVEVSMSITVVFEIK